LKFRFLSTPPRLQKLEYLAQMIMVTINAMIKKLAMAMLILVVEPAMGVLVAHL